jgi:hypothetical protein
MRETVLMRNARFDLVVVLELIGAMAGIAGAALMALNPAELAGLAFSIWLVSSLSLAAFAFLSRLKYLLMLQVVFCVINTFGVFNNVFGGI